jgi:hypothetical protein
VIPGEIHGIIPYRGDKGSMMLEKDRQWRSLKAAQEEVEALFMDSPVEHGALVSEDGRLIVEEEGLKKSVEFSERDLRRVSDGAFFHNHPSGTSVSLDDLKIACDYNPAFLSVFGVNSKRIAYRYTVQRPKGGWPSRRDLSKSHTKAVKSAEEALYRRVFPRGTMSRLEFDLEIAHEEMRRLAKLIGAKYNRVRVERSQGT